MTEDKKTIGLTPENRSVMEQIMDKGFFRDQKDAALFAMGYAINRGIELGSAEGTNTIWNVGSLDPDGEIRLLVGNLFPDTSTPYRLVESFVNAGLAHIGSRMIKEPGMDLNDLLRESPTPAASPSNPPSAEKA
jgi:hypothetical protein